LVNVVTAEDVTTNICDPVCRNGAECALTEFDDEYEYEYFCDCPPYFAGISCEFEATSICSTSPRDICVNGGVCRREGGDFVGCVCPPDFLGIRCEYDYCDLVCLNGGECDFADDADDDTGDDVMPKQQQYCKCAEGFSGLQCEEPQDDEWCTLDCTNGGVCGLDRRRHHRRGLDEQEPEEEGQFFCTCPPGFVGALCEEDDEAEWCTLTCFNGGVCQLLDTPDDDQLLDTPDDDNDNDNNQGGMACECPDGFSGRECQSFVQDDVCVLECANGGACMHDHDGRIILEEDDDGQSGEFCVCPVGFVGERKPCSNGGICRLVDCRLVEIAVDCDDDVADDQVIIDQEICECPVGFSGTFCQIKEDCRLECLNGGMCMLQSGRLLDEDGSDVSEEFCLCPDGYSGERCEIRKCLVQCQNNGTCQTILDERNIDEQICECPDGFSGVFCDIQDCTLECQNGGFCKILSGEQYNQDCLCSEGFDGSFCENRICSAACQNGGVCETVVVNGEESERCNCPPGYVDEICEIFLPELINQTQSPSPTSGTTTSSPPTNDDMPTSSPPTSIPVNDDSGSIRVTLTGSLVVGLSLSFYLG
jgi:hypothetical protein